MGFASTQVVSLLPKAPALSNLAALVADVFKNASFDGNLFTERSYIVLMPLQAIQPPVVHGMEGGDAPLAIVYYRNIQLEKRRSGRIYCARIKLVDQNIEAVVRCIAGSRLRSSLTGFAYRYEHCVL